MKNKILFVPAIALSFISVMLLESNPARVQAAVSDWQKGGSMYPTWSGDFDTSSFKQSMQDLKSIGATHVALIIPIYQANLNSSDIYAGGNTPSDASIAGAVSYAKSLGLKVMLKPHLDSQTGQWRALINASDRDSWFTNYGNYLNRLGDIGKQNGADSICIGTELITMATQTSNNDNTQRWNKLISNLRQHFSGQLTYSANWGGDYFTEEGPHIGFWPSLDFIGLSAYYPLAPGQWNPSVEALAGSWAYWDSSKIKALHDQYGKQIVFTEIGYRSSDNAHNAPWDPFMGGGYNGSEQANDYEALFTYWNNQSHMSGMFLWNWDSDPNAGGSGNTNYTPQNKPAEQVLAKWFAGGGSGGNDGSGNGGGSGTTTPPTPPTPPADGSSSTGNYTVGASATPLSAGKESTITVNVANSGSANNVIIDVEIYNSNDNKIFQKFFTGQNISPSHNGQYTLTWTPPGQGVYTLKLGAFSSDWSSNYYWNNSVIPLSIDGAGNGGGSAGPLTTDIWWPVDGVTVQGVQPFKALVQNRSLSSYKMYWQVGDGNLVEMYDSDQDYPHKEAQVDFKDWTWNGSGPYTITFISKDSSGIVISKKSIDLRVSQ